MVDSLLRALAFIFRAADSVLGAAVAMSRTQRLARRFTGSAAIVEVPPEQKAVPSAAQRALAEAEARHRDGASFIDKYIGPSRQ